MANQYDIGDVVRISAAFKNMAKVLVDPTTITLEIKNPSGTIITWVYDVDPEVIRTGAGVYYADYLIEKSGIHYFKWFGTGDVTAAEEWQFFVKATQF